MGLQTAEDDALRDVTLRSLHRLRRCSSAPSTKACRWSRRPRDISTARAATESRDLPRKTAMLYAGESMRVTTRLMQAASWLLVQRAVHDGDMEPEDATSERYRLGSKEICLGRGADGVELLPAKRCAICLSAATISIAASRVWMMSCSPKEPDGPPASRNTSTASSAPSAATARPDTEKRRASFC